MVQDLSNGFIDAYEPIVTRREQTECGEREGSQLFRVDGMLIRLVYDEVRNMDFNRHGERKQSGVYATFSDLAPVSMPTTVLNNASTQTSYRTGLDLALESDKN